VKWDRLFSRVEEVLEPTSFVPHGGGVVGAGRAGLVVDHPQASGGQRVHTVDGAPHLDRAPGWERNLDRRDDGVVESEAQLRRFPRRQIALDHADERANLVPELAQLVLIHDSRGGRHLETHRFRLFPEEIEREKRGSSGAIPASLLSANARS
jgi:hypothetical protein